jgi:hypothetical protein
MLLIDHRIATLELVVVEGLLRVGLGIGIGIGIVTRRGITALGIGLKVGSGLGVVKVLVHIRGGGGGSGDVGGGGVPRGPTHTLTSIVTITEVRQEIFFLVEGVRDVELEASFGAIGFLGSSILVEARLGLGSGGFEGAWELRQVLQGQQLQRKEVEQVLARHVFLGRSQVIHRFALLGRDGIRGEGGNGSECQSYEKLYQPIDF